MSPHTATTAAAPAIKITPALRKAINAAVRQHTGGANPLAEVGLRQMGDARHVLPNALNWDDASDLGDLVRLANLSEIDGHDDAPGCAELDLYVTTGIGSARELETNVCILIRDGAVVGATAHSLKVAALKAAIGFPTGKGF